MLELGALIINDLATELGILLGYWPPHCLLGSLSSLLNFKADMEWYVSISFSVFFGSGQTRVWKFMASMGTMCLSKIAMGPKMSADT